MKQMRVLTYVASFGLMLGLTGCMPRTAQEPKPKPELEPEKSVSGDLEKAEAQRLELMAQMGSATRMSDQLQKQLRTELEQKVESLTLERNELKDKVDSLAKSNGVLQEQIIDLIQSRNAAASEARDAQKERDTLHAQLEIEAKKTDKLEENLKQITELQEIIEKLQAELAKVVKSRPATADSGSTAGRVVEAPAESN